MPSQRFNLPFLGPSATTRSPWLNAERTINWYIEPVDSGGARQPWALYGTPGLKKLMTLPGAGGIRGMHQETRNRRPFAVRGDKLYQLTSPTSFVERGTIVGHDTRVAMDNTSVEMCVLANRQGWIFNLDTEKFEPITDPAFRPADTVIATDEYFVFNATGTSQFFFSNLLKGLVYNGADFQSSQGSPDKIRAVHRSHGQVWTMGEDTVQVYHNTGQSSRPFTVLQNAFMEIGTSSAATVVQLNDATYWVGHNEDGGGVVWRAAGFAQEPISTHAVSLDLDATDAEAVSAYGYQQEKHFFYVLQTLKSTWCYDASNGLWTQRARLTPEGTLAPHKCWVHMFAFGKHLLGDQSTGDIYEASLDVFTDDGAPIPRIRRAPYWAVQGRKSTHAMVQLDMEMGAGLGAGELVGSDPQVTLAWSDSYSKSWGNQHRMSLGRQGEYRTRARHWKLGQTIDRVYEAVVTAPVRVAMVAAYVHATVS